MVAEPEYVETNVALKHDVLDQRVSTLENARDEITAELQSNVRSLQSTVQDLTQRLSRLEPQPTNTPSQPTQPSNAPSQYGGGF